MAGKVSRPSAVGGGQPAVAERLAGLIREARSVVALTGAGISVPSGIPDFRTPGKGLWEKVDPMKVAHIDAFHRNTKEFWRFYRPRFADSTASRRTGPIWRSPSSRRGGCSTRS